MLWNIFLLILVEFAFAAQPEISVNLKMVIVFGEPSEFTESSVVTTQDSWDECLKKCLEEWNCVLAQQDVDECKHFRFSDIEGVKKLDSSSGKRVAFKISLPDNNCPLSDDAPLFGEPTSSLIISDGEKFYKSEISSDGVTWKFTNSIHRCVEKIPADCDVPTTGYKKVYWYNLTGEFLVGQEFVIKGKDIYKRFSMDLYSNSDGSWPLHVHVYNYRGTDIRTYYKNGTAVDEETYINTTYKAGDAFEIHIKATEVSFLIHFDQLEVIYKYRDGFPISTITNFVINNSDLDSQGVKLEYICWTGNCKFRPLD